MNYLLALTLISLGLGLLGSYLRSQNNESGFSSDDGTRNRGVSITANCTSLSVFRSFHQIYSYQPLAPDHFSPPTFC